MVDWPKGGSLSQGDQSGNLDLEAERKFFSIRRKLDTGECDLLVATPSLWVNEQITPAGCEIEDVN